MKLWPLYRVCIYYITEQWLYLPPFFIFIFCCLQFKKLYNLFGLLTPVEVLLTITSPSNEEQVSLAQHRPIPRWRVCRTGFVFPQRQVEPHAARFFRSSGDLSANKAYFIWVSWFFLGLSLRKPIYIIVPLRNSLHIRPITRAL